MDEGVLVEDLSTGDGAGSGSGDSLGVGSGVPLVDSGVGTSKVDKGKAVAMPEVTCLRLQKRLSLRW